MSEENIWVKEGKIVYWLFFESTDHTSPFYTDLVDVTKDLKEQLSVDVQLRDLGMKHNKSIVTCNTLRYYLMIDKLLTLTLYKK